MDSSKSPVISLSSIRQTAINHFETIKCKPFLQTSKNTNSRRPLRFIEPKTSNTILPHINQEYDLNSKQLRRCIIEDIVYIKPIHNILLLVCDDSLDFLYWKNIIEEQDSGLLTLVFRTKIYYQINALVIKM